MRAREGATLLLATLNHEEMVQRFLDVYAAEYRRPGRADQPGHYHEQLTTIRREAILVMVLRVESALPSQLKVRVAVEKPARKAKKKKGKKKAAKKTKAGGWDLSIPVLDLFREEFFSALGQALRWSEDDADEFWHDLELYEKLKAIPPRKRAMRAVRNVAAGPFVDRVGMLLDPSLMDQARREAGKFEVELNAAADRVLRKVFSRRRAN